MSFSSVGCCCASHVETHLCRFAPPIPVRSLLFCLSLSVWDEAALCYIHCGCVCGRVCGSLRAIVTSPALCTLSFFCLTALFFPPLSLLSYFSPPTLFLSPLTVCSSAVLNPVPCWLFWTPSPHPWCFSCGFCFCSCSCRTPACMIRSIGT